MTIGFICRKPWRCLLLTIQTHRNQVADEVCLTYGDDGIEFLCWNEVHIGGHCVSNGSKRGGRRGGGQDEAAEHWMLARHPYESNLRDIASHSPPRFGSLSTGVLQYM
jgi:hypothetical protein